MKVPFLDLKAMHAEIARDLDRAWREVSHSRQFVGGEFVARFEADWAAYCGVRHCVGLANGTAALQLCLTGLGIGPGDEVIVPTNTFIATAAAVVAAGATPVFIDVGPENLLMTAAGVEAALGPRTAAVIAVHLYGHPVDMDALSQVAGRAGIAVIEDAAQAHGATWRGRRAGSLGDAGCFSFYPGKNLGAFGDAGAVVTDDVALAERIRALSNHGRGQLPYRHDLIGTNNRLDGLQAAVLSAKVPCLDTWLERRRRAAQAYETYLAGLPVRLVQPTPGAASAHHLAVIQVPRRDELRDRLAAAGISCGIHYPIPCHRQPAFAAAAQPTLAVAERAAERILSLPMFPHLSDRQIRFIVGALREALDELAGPHRLAS
jgi:dTDP-4-amino-4,6-dideoxygalactose transaminase